MVFSVITKSVVPVDIVLVLLHCMVHKPSHLWPLCYKGISQSLVDYSLLGIRFAKFWWFFTNNKFLNTFWVSGCIFEVDLPLYNTLQWRKYWGYITRMLFKVGSPLFYFNCFPMSLDPMVFSEFKNGELRDSCSNSI